MAPATAGRHLPSQIHSYSTLGRFFSSRSRSALSALENQGLSRQESAMPNASAGNCRTNLIHVGSDSSSGLNVTQTSDPSLRIVGSNICQERSETTCASSTQQISNPSYDLSDSALWSERPVKANSVPSGP